MDADGLIDGLFNAGVAVSIVATVVSLGMSLTVGEVLRPLRRIGLVLAVVVLNVALIPAAAWGITGLAGLPDDAATGIALAAIGSAGAAGLKAAQLSRRADLALAVSLVVVLQLLNILAVPLWARRVVGGATISPATILQNLLLLVLVPLVVGLVVRSRAASRAERWQGTLVRIANLALAIALMAGVTAHLEAIMELIGSKTMLASIAIVVLAVVAGMAIAGREVATRATTGLVSGMRFASLGLIIIGTQLDGDAAVLGPAIVFALVDMVVAVSIALVMGRRTSAVATSPAN
jgi:BASS family bile acid:Na+ symporter